MNWTGTQAACGADRGKRAGLGHCTNTHLEDACARVRILLWLRVGACVLCWKQGVWWLLCLPLQLVLAMLLPVWSVCIWLASLARGKQ